MAVEHRNGLTEDPQYFQKKERKSQTRKTYKRKIEGDTVIPNFQIHNSPVTNDSLRKRQRKKKCKMKEKRKIIIPNGTNSMDEIPGHTRYTQYFPFY